MRICGRLTLTVATLAILVSLLAGCASGGSSARNVPTGRMYSFWPPPPDEPRIQFLRAFRFSSDVEEERSAFDRIVFGEEATILPIAKPYGVEMWNGRIYVCDITNPGVVILDLVERQTRLMVTRGVEQMAQPTDIAIADDGLKYVVDRRLGRIFVFDADDRHITAFGERGLIPVGAAVRGDELFVPDFETQSVLVLDRFTGERRRSIGGPGGGEGQFVRPLGVHVDEAGEVFVSDAIRGWVQRFTPDGELVKSMGQIGDAPGSFVRPKHVAVDADGILYVVDAAFQNVQMFNADGELLMFFGGAGEYDGSMSLPAGIFVHETNIELFEAAIHPAFEAKRLVLVTNQFGLNKVSVYALGQLRKGYTIADIAPDIAELRRQSPSEVGAGEPPGEPAGEGGS
jgi:DNA-binding beta-propeller fold protein YncE